MQSLDEQAAWRQGWLVCEESASPTDRLFRPSHGVDVFWFFWKPWYWYWRETQIGSSSGYTLPFLRKNLEES